jgi:hypothetical protein
MKKQTEIVTTTATRPAAKKIELIFLVVIATVIYRNQSNRRLPSMPPNSLGLAKQAVQSIIEGSEKAITKMASFFYNVTGESVASLFQFLAIVGLLVVLVVAIIYIIRTH